MLNPKKEQHDRVKTGSMTLLGSDFACRMYRPRKCSSPKPTTDLMKDPKKLQEIQMRADWLARLMDEAITIPVINVKLGWDSILGFIPGIGDLIGMIVQLVLIWHAFQAGVRKRTYLKMIGNALIDFAIGTIPLLGDVFDIFFKSNRKNAELLRREITRATKQ